MGPGWGQISDPELFHRLLSGALIGRPYLTGAKSRRDVIPFGPFMALGALILVFSMPQSTNGCTPSGPDKTMKRGIKGKSGGSA